MAYIEWLRVRRRLIVFACVLVTFTALIVLPALFGHVHGDTHGGGTVSVDVGSGVHGEPVRRTLQEALGKTTVPLSALLGAAAILSLIFTTALGSSLNAQHASLSLAFTRPLPRERLALAFFSVDAAAIVASFALAFLLACVVPLLGLGILNRVYFDSQAWLVTLVSIGISLMFYGVLQAATAWARGGTALIVGLAWPVFLIAAIPGTPPFGPIVNALLAVVRFFDPLVYLRMAGFLVALPGDFGTAKLITVTLTVWAIALVTCALATVEWRRLEV